MELKLNEKEVADILLAWAEKNFLPQFNTVKFDTSYGTFRSALLTKSEPEDAQS